MMPRNTRVVDLAAIENNMRTICSAVPSGVKVMAVVKADGYGHGACETAAAALKGGACMLAVASVSEGRQLRERGISSPVLVLGAVMESDVAEGTEYDLIQTVCSPDMVRLCEKAAAAQGKYADVHLKIDTGMGRIGVRNENERDSVLSEIERCSHVRLKGVYTHFSDADGDEEGIQYTRQQYQKFLHLVECLPAEIIRHCCNSAAIDRFPEMSLDMVRAGISLYGYPPVPTRLSLKKCMSWYAEISYIKEVEAGSCISYGRKYKAGSTIRTATVTCGYGDGYHRKAGEKGYVLIHGKRAKILGRVCMDQMVVDITSIENVSAGDTAVLIGEDGKDSIDADEIADWADTISYEILLSAGQRVERIYR